MRMISTTMNRQASKRVKILRNEIVLFRPLLIIPLIWWTLPSGKLILLRLPTFWWLTMLEWFEGGWNGLSRISCCQRGLPTFWWRKELATVCQRVMGKLLNCSSTRSWDFKLSQKSLNQDWMWNLGVASCEIPPFFALRLHFGRRTQRCAPNPRW